MPEQRQNNDQIPLITGSNGITIDLASDKFEVNVGGPGSVTITALDDLEVSKVIVVDNGVGADPFTLDSSIDWRDRFLYVYGVIHRTASPVVAPGNANDENILFGMAGDKGWDSGAVNEDLRTIYNAAVNDKIHFYGASAVQTPTRVWAFFYTGPGGLGNDYAIETNDTGRNIRANSSTGNLELYGSAVNIDATLFILASGDLGGYA